MVAFQIVPVSLWIVGLFTVAQVLKPRLPKYSFRIQRIVPNWISKQGLFAKLGSKVKLHNDNFVPINIHSLSFDLFYPDWSGDLDHIGQVTDVFYHHGNDDAKAEQKASPLWELLPRESFETTDTVVMKPAGGFGVMSSLSWDLMKKWGVVTVPSSGVIHVKANGKIPLTLSILCENSLDTWTLEMQGISCELDTLDIGWVDLPAAVARLRTKVVAQQTELTEEATPAIEAPQPPKKKKSWKNVLPIKARA